MKKLLAAASMAMLIATPAFAQMPGAADTSRIAAATYKVDGHHTQVVWSLNHMGFSVLYGMFGEMTGSLTLDPANPAAAKVVIDIPMSGSTTTSPGFTKHPPARTCSTSRSSRPPSSSRPRSSSTARPPRSTAT